MGIMISLFSLWGCFHFRALFLAVRQLCSLPHPLSSTVGGWLCEFQLQFPAVPPAAHQPCPPEPERTEAAAVPVSEWGPAHPSQLGGAHPLRQQHLCYRVVLLSKEEPQRAGNAWYAGSLLRSWKCISGKELACNQSHTSSRPHNRWEAFRKNPDGDDC